MRIETFQLKVCLKVNVLMEPNDFPSFFGHRMSFVDFVGSPPSFGPNCNRLLRFERP
jgi:hypothetical protein